MIGTKVNATIKDEDISGTVTHTDDAGNIYIDVGKHVTKVVRPEHITEESPKTRLKKVKP